VSHCSVLQQRVTVVPHWAVCYFTWYYSKKDSRLCHTELSVVVVTVVPHWAVCYVTWYYSKKDSRLCHTELSVVVVDIIAWKTHACVTLFSITAKSKGFVTLSCLLFYLILQQERLKTVSHSAVIKLLCVVVVDIITRNTERCVTLSCLLLWFDIVARKTQGCVRQSCYLTYLPLSLDGCLWIVNSWWMNIINTRLSCPSSLTAIVCLFPVYHYIVINI